MSSGQAVKNLFNIAKKPCCFEILFSWSSNCLFFGVSLQGTLKSSFRVTDKCIYFPNIKLYFDDLKYWVKILSFCPTLTPKLILPWDKALTVWFYSLENRCYSFFLELESFIAPWCKILFSLLCIEIEPLMIPVLVLFAWWAARIAACWLVKNIWFYLGGGPEPLVIVNMAEENIDTPEMVYCWNVQAFLCKIIYL